MVDRILSLSELNRTLLDRQLLLRRHDLTVVAAVERLVGLQAQIPNPPYIGLWTRLQQVQRADLTQAMEQRQIVRAALMRSTLHLVTADDHTRFRTALQPALTRALAAFFGKRTQGLAIEPLVAAARPFIEAAPRTTGELRARLIELNPDRDGDALAYAVRNFLPLVQLPPGGTWGSGSGGAYVTAASYIGEPDPATNIGVMFRRYLAAFGPASIMDFQAWSGMTSLKTVMEPYTGDLRTYRDPAGKVLYDLPDLTITPADTPAPVRLLPEYDNLLLSHADRTRIIADEDRPLVFLSAGRVRSTYLVAGMVSGAWKIEKVKKQQTLIFEPFRPLTDAVRAALEAEGASLLRFTGDDEATGQIVFSV